MCTAALKPTITAPFTLELEGPGGGTWTVAPTDGPQACVVTAGPAEDGIGTVTSSTADFVRWSTKRADWRLLAAMTGDEESLATVLDAVNLI